MKFVSCSIPRLFRGLLLVQVILVAGCAPQPVPDASQPSPSREVATATVKPSPTAEPAATSIPSPTPAPDPQPITAANAASLEPVMSLGRGAIADIAWSPDSAAITVATTQGLWTYNAADFEQATSIKTPAHQTVVRYSPDGKSLVSGGMDGTVTLWDTAGGTEIRHWQANAGVVSALAFSPDGAQIAAASFPVEMDFDNTVYPAPNAVIQIWDSQGGDELHHMESKMIAIYLLNWLPDSSGLVVVGQSARYWTPDGQVGSTLSYKSGDALVELWDLAQEKALTSWTHSKRIQTAAMLPDGRVATFPKPEAAEKEGTIQEQVKIWDTATGAAQAFLPYPGRLGGGVTSLGASPDGKTLVVTGLRHDGDEILTCEMAGFGLPGFKRTITFEGMGSHLVFSPDGSRMAGLSYLCGEPVSGSALQVWDAGTGEVLTNVPWHSMPQVLTPAGGILIYTRGMGHVLDISPDRATILAGGTAWDIATGQARSLPRPASKRMAYTADGRRIIAGGMYGYTLWDADTLETLEDVDISLFPKKPGELYVDSTIVSMSISPDGSAAALSSGFNKKHRTMLVDFTGRKDPDRSFLLEGYAIQSISSGGRVLAINRDPYVFAIRFFRFDDSWTTWENPFVDLIPPPPLDLGDTLEFYTFQLMILNPDGTQAVTCGDLDATARIWDFAELSKEIASVTFGTPGGYTAIREFPPSNTCYDAVYNPDGTLIALALHDGSIRVYDAALKTELARLETGHPEVAVTFSRDGMMLAALSADGIVDVWEVLN